MGSISIAKTVHKYHISLFTMMSTLRMCDDEYSAKSLKRLINVIESS